MRRGRERSASEISEVKFLRRERGSEGSGTESETPGTADAVEELEELEFFPEFCLPFPLLVPFLVVLPSES